MAFTAPVLNARCRHPRILYTISRGGIIGAAVHGGFMGSWDSFHIIVAIGIVIGVVALWEIRSVLGSVFDRLMRLESAIDKLRFANETEITNLREELAAGIGESNQELREILSKLESVIPSTPSDPP